MGADHTHHGCGHSKNVQRVFWALVLTASFMVVEVIGGFISGSLALLADSAHMLVDVVSLFSAWLAFRLSRRSADKVRTFGFHRFPILAAFANGISLIFVVIWIFFEAFDRMLNPGQVLAGTMLTVASLGLVINMASFAVLHGADRKNLNIRGAMLHVIGDMLGSIAAISAALIMMSTGWIMIDPILSGLIGLFIIRSAWFLVKDAANVLLESVPDHLDVREIGADLMQQISGVDDVHHVHAWTLSQEHTLVTLHARIVEDANHDSIIAEIQDRLAKKFGINHVTVQIESELCADDLTTSPI